MIFSFDLDGTYIGHEEVFDSLAELLQGSGHEVGILTNRPEHIELGFDFGFDPDFEYYLGLSDENFMSINSHEH